GDRSAENVALFDEVKQDLGYGLLLKKYTENIAEATEEQIKLAAADTIPHVPSIFWAFRFMVGAGFLMLLLFVLAFWASTKHNQEHKTWLLRFALLSLPLPWVGVQAGWYVAEVGRQPWSIGEVLPTFLSTSSLSSGDVLGTIITIAVIYTVLIIIEMFLMIRFARKGPSCLHTGRYHFEQNTTKNL
ncbi:MAG: cytochrome ubiquinol oxidase subunit I, partial [Thiopseudomonas sp.]|nr:cytochrome ubiquinol oxidase subunit I [Thiopseudomonas sp.]